MYRNTPAFMNEVRIYQDSKELPLWNYKRILQTEDFFYMIKGYDAGDSIECNIEELKGKFEAIEQEVAFSLNEKNADIVNYANYEKAKLELSIYVVLLQVLELKIKEKSLSQELELECDLTAFLELLSEFKIEKSEDLNIQKEIIERKINKIENDLQEQLKKIGKEDNSQEKGDYDIDEQIINVKIGLETDFDERKTSLYQYQVYIKALMKKIDQLSKMNQK